MGEPRIRFLVGGVQKGGTTALARLLSQHPCIRLPDRMPDDAPVPDGDLGIAWKKEAHVFDAPWFDDAWSTADLLANVISGYRKRYRQQPVPRGPHEERTSAARKFAAPVNRNVVTGPLAVQLAHAQALWVRTESLYANRGAGNPGNQLDTQRGTRAFFGFTTNMVDKNHIFGDVEIQVPGHRSVSRSVRFGNNLMDKINLPIPGRDGPETYDHSILIFERAGVGTSGLSHFKLTVTDAAGLAARKARANNSIDAQMHGGREFGLLF